MTVAKDNHQGGNAESLQCTVRSRMMVVEEKSDSRPGAVKAELAGRETEGAIICSCSGLPFLLETADDGFSFSFQAHRLPVPMTPSR
jgi:hypothetical protein